MYDFKKMPSGNYLNDEWRWIYTEEQLCSFLIIASFYFPNLPKLDLVAIAFVAFHKKKYLKDWKLIQFDN